MWARIRKAIVAIVGPDECILLCGLVLVTVGLWPVIGRSALIVPGIVLLWIAFPQREAFIARQPSRQDPRSLRRVG